MKTKIAIAVVSVILVVSVTANAYFYAQHYRFVTDSVLLDRLQRENSNLQSENAILQSQLNQTKAPKLVTRLGATDVRTNVTGHPIPDFRLYIEGEVWNVGTAVAQKCRLWVTLYQGDVVAKYDYIDLGTIACGSWKDVATNVQYQGVELTNWTITPEFG